MSALGDGSRFDASLTYIHQAEPLGLAHAVWTAREFLGEDSFIMYLGDNLIQHGVRHFVEQFEATDVDALILLKAVENPRSFGVAELAPNGRILSLEEKPQNPKSNLALVGVYLFSPAIHEMIATLKPSARGELEITDAIQDLIDRGLDVHPHIVRGWWKDTGKLEDMLEANRIVLESLETRRGANIQEVGRGSRIEGRVQLGEGVELIDSLVRGPVVIGDGTRLENAFVGPYTSIGERCTLVCCELENSIVLADSEIRDIPLRIDGSLIGRNVRIVKTDFKPKAYRFMLGDNSEVGIT